MYLGQTRTAAQIWLSCVRPICSQLHEAYKCGQTWQYTMRSQAGWCVRKISSSKLDTYLIERSECVVCVRVSAVAAGRPARGADKRGRVTACGLTDRLACLKNCVCDVRSRVCWPAEQPARGRGRDRGRCVRVTASETQSLLKAYPRAKCQSRLRSCIICEYWIERTFLLQKQSQE